MRLKKMRQSSWHQNRRLAMTNYKRQNILAQEQQKLHPESKIKIMNDAVYNFSKLIYK